MSRISPLLLFLLLCFTVPVLAQGNVRISGFVTDLQSHPLELVSVSELNGKHATYTDSRGFYTLSVPAADTVILKYSCISFQTSSRIIPVTQSDLQVHVVLHNSSHLLNEITVRGQQRRTSTMESLDAGKIRLLPDATGGSIEALLVTFAGVNSNNELSSQYSVRGGNFDENLVYVNGTEVYRPLLIRSGQQEGMSFINPEMVQDVRFSAGGFDVRYGDKMSSVLDIQYKKPSAFESTVNMSLLGANAYIGQSSKNGRFTQIHGFRYKTNAYLLGTLDTKAEYNPRFLDYQTFMTYKLSPTLELSFLGNYSQNTYEFTPKEGTTEFGLYNYKLNMTVYFDGMEKDVFRTSFASFSLNKTLTDKIKLSLSTSAFNTVEDENYDISGQYWLSQTPIKNNRADTANTTLLGIGTYHEHARNHLNASVLNIQHAGSWKMENHELQWGLSLQHESIKDQLREWKMRDSAGYSLPHDEKDIHLVYSLKSAVTMESNRLQGYVQDNWRWRNQSGLFVLTAGVRGNWWDYNKELVVSPRASISYVPAIHNNLTFRLAGGVYYQTPFYKELRDTFTLNGATNIRLNKSIKAQRTNQIIAGMDYHFTGLGIPFKLTTECYYKDMKNLIPYTVDNVRIRYMGRNLAKGYTTGVDAKLYGELVPGADSWLSMSLMKSRETMDGYTVPRPNEQRYSVALYFQDYFPDNPRVMMNLKLIWADGLPFGAPDRGRQGAVLRMPPYRRVDIGISRMLVGGEEKIMRNKIMKHFKTLWLGLDCFNLFAIRNTNSYYWVSDITNTQWAVPNYLTGRLINLRLTADF